MTTTQNTNTYPPTDQDPFHGEFFDCVPYEENSNTETQITTETGNQYNDPSRLSLLKRAAIEITMNEPGESLIIACAVLNMGTGITGLAAGIVAVNRVWRLLSNYLSIKGCNDELLQISLLNDQMKKNTLAALESINRIRDIKFHLDVSHSGIKDAISSITSSLNNAETALKEHNIKQLEELENQLTSIKQQQQDLKEITRELQESIDSTQSIDDTCNEIFTMVEEDSFSTDESRSELKQKLTFIQETVTQVSNRLHRSNHSIVDALRENQKILDASQKLWKNEQLLTEAKVKYAKELETIVNDLQTKLREANQKTNDLGIESEVLRSINLEQQDMIASQKRAIIEEAKKDLIDTDSLLTGTLLSSLVIGGIAIANGIAPLGVLLCSAVGGGFYGKLGAPAVNKYVQDQRTEEILKTEMQMKEIFKMVTYPQFTIFANYGNSQGGVSWVKKSITNSVTSLINPYLDENNRFFDEKSNRCGEIEFVVGIDQHFFLKFDSSSVHNKNLKTFGAIIAPHQLILNDFLQRSLEKGKMRPEDVLSLLQKLEQVTVQIIDGSKIISMITSSSLLTKSLKTKAFDLMRSQGMPLLEATNLNV